MKEFKPKTFCKTCQYQGVCTTCPHCVTPTIGPCMVKINVIEFARFLGFLDKHKRLLHGGIVATDVINYLVNTHRKVKEEDLRASLERAI